jgi:PAS domain S-box-containing protein
MNDSPRIKSPRHHGRTRAAARPASGGAARARPALDDTETRYKSLFEGIPIGFFLAGPERRIQEANPALAQILGHADRRSLIGLDLRRLFAEPRDGEELLDRLARGGVVRAFEARARRSDGAIWIRVTARVAPAAVGPAVHYEGAVEDITERRRAEEWLAESENRLRTIIDSEPECVKVLGPDGRLLEINRAGLAMVEADSPEQVLGRPVDSIVAAKDRRAFKDLTRRVLRGTSGILTFEIVGLKGTRRRLETHAVPLRSLKGEITALLSVTRDITERKQAEEELRQSIERFELIARATNDGVFDWNMVTNEAWWNEASYRLYEYDPATTVPSFETWSARIHPEDRPRLLSSFQEAIDRRADSWQDEYRLLLPGGSTRHVFDRVYILKDESGRPVRMIGAVLDVTARKEAERALRESEERYRLLFEGNPQSMWVYDLETLRFLAVNNAAIHTYGYSRDEFLGMTVKDIRPPEEVPALLRKISGIQGFDRSDTWRHRRKDGTVMEVEVSSHPLGFAGRPARLVQATDITEQKRAEHQRRLAESQYRDIFENAIEGIGQATPEGRILTANPALAEMLGYGSPRKLIESGTDVRLLVISDAKRGSKWVHQIHDQGSVSGIEAQVRRRDGTVIWVSANVRVVRDDQGRILYYEGTAQDVSERKRAEESLRELSGRLLRSQDEERRRIARELHDSTAQSLAALGMDLVLVKKAASTLGPKARRSLDEGLALAEQCTREIRTLAYLLHPPTLDDVGLASAIRWYVKGFIERSRIPVELTLSEHLPRLASDAETALFRVVQESLTNIHRHSGSQTASIRVTHDQAGITLRVRDRGRGLPRIVRRSPDGPLAGLGVGLAGMSERVRQLGGWLEIDSSRRGTTVKVTMPIVRGEA